MGPKKQKMLGQRNKSHTKVQSFVATSNRSFPLELQQRILNVFSAAFPVADLPSLTCTIQEVKAHLYNRDFAAAFGTQKYLDAYALRWSASRALAYSEIFAGLDPWSTSKGPVAEEANLQPSKLVCIGGGAGAEVVAATRFKEVKCLDVIAFDVADWSQCLQKLQTSLTTTPALFQYASESARAANGPLFGPGQLNVRFMQSDILDYKDADLQSMLTGVGLVTILFTLNELFTASLSKTTAFLLALGEFMDIGASLLVVDSPGSYSEVKLGKVGETKRYPMKWLLDHTLLEVAGRGQWTKDVDEDSRWFRVDGKLKYPIELESMRYQMHLYRRIDAEADE